MKKLYYIDTFSYYHLHEMFDASSLEMFSYMADHVEYRAHKTSIKCVQQLIGKFPPNIRIKTIPGINGTNKITRFLKQICATIINTYYIFYAKKNDIIVINYNTAIALYFINWASKLTGHKVLLICHGEMQDLVVKRKTSTLFKKSMSLFLKPNIHIATNLYFAVLGNAIYNNVIQIVSPQVKKKLLSFEHSAIFNQIPLLPIQPHNKLILGMVGGIRESKGISSLLALSKALQNYNNIEIRVIGYIDYDIEKLQQANIRIPKGVGKHFLSRQELYDNIRQLDYVICLYPKDGYKFTASGSIFDAIDCERPILGIKNDYFDNLFKQYGKFGYLEDTLEGVISKAKELATNIHEQEHFNIKSVKEKISPKSIAQTFDIQFKDKFNISNL